MPLTLRLADTNLRVKRRNYQHGLSKKSQSVVVPPHQHIYIRQTAYIYPACCIYISSKQACYKLHPHLSPSLPHGTCIASRTFQAANYPLFKWAIRHYSSSKPTTIPSDKLFTWTVVNLSIHPLVFRVLKGYLLPIHRTTVLHRSYHTACPFIVSSPSALSRNPTAWKEGWMERKAIHIHTESTVNKHF